MTSSSVICTEITGRCGWLGGPGKKLPSPSSKPASQHSSSRSKSSGTIRTHVRIRTGRGRRAAGEGIEPSFSGPKPDVVSHWTTPQWDSEGYAGSAVAYDPPVPLTAVILAAGQGTRMRSKTPKVLHDLCGWPLVRWPVEAAREAGAGEGRGRRWAGPGGRGARARRHEIAVQQEAEGDRRRGQGGGRAHRRRGHRRRALRRRPAHHRRRPSPTLAAGATRRQAAAVMVTTSLDDPSGYGRVVRDADGSVEKVVETKNPEDATPEELRDQGGQHRHLRVRRRQAEARARARSPPTTPRASTTCPTSSRSSARRATASSPTRSPTRRSRSASTTARSSRRSARSPSGGSSTTTSAPA